MDEINVILWTCNFLLITFSISLPSVLKSIMRQKAFEVLYKGLFSFRIIIIDDNFFKVHQPVAKVDTCVYYINNVRTVFTVFSTSLR